jgi:hypothetical protein
LYDEEVARIAELILNPPKIPKTQMPSDMTASHDTERCSWCLKGTCSIMRNQDDISLDGSDIDSDYDRYTLDDRQVFQRDSRRPQYVAQQRPTQRPQYNSTQIPHVSSNVPGRPQTYQPPVPPTRDVSYWATQTRENPMSSQTQNQESESSCLMM